MRLFHFAHALHLPFRTLSKVRSYNSEHKAEEEEDAHGTVQEEEPKAVKVAVNGWEHHVWKICSGEKNEQLEYGAANGPKIIRAGFLCEDCAWRPRSVMHLSIILKASPLPSFKIDSFDSSEQLMRYEPIQDYPEGEQKQHICDFARRLDRG